MKYCLQLYNDDCAFSCFKNLLYLTTNNKEFLKLPNPKLSGEYSFYDLMLYASSYYVILRGYHVDDIALLNNSLPCICEIKINEKKHDILLYKIKKNKYYFIDPSYGKASLSKNDFISIFTNNILKVDSIKNNNNFKIINPLQKISLMYFLVQFVLNIAIVTLCAFLNKSVGFYIGSLILFCLLFLLSKYSALLYDSIYEKKINEKIFFSPFKKNDEIYRRLYFIKENIAKDISSFINNGIMIIFIFVMLLINNYYLLLTLFLLIINGVLGFLTLHNKEYDILFNEQLTFVKTLKKEKYLTLKKKLNKYKALKLLFNIFNIIIVFISLIILAMFDQHYSLNFLLFYFFTFIYFTYALNNMLLFSKKKDTFNIYINTIITLSTYH